MTIYRHRVAVHVKAERARREDCPACRPRGAAQQHADAGEEFVHAERLRQVIVCPFVQRLHLAGVVSDGAQQEDGYRIARPDLAAKCNAVRIREDEIEEHDLGPELLDNADDVPPRPQSADAIRPRLQRPADTPEDGRVVIDQEDARATHRGGGLADGMLIWNRVSREFELTLTVPSQSSTMAFTIDSPSPVPLTPASEAPR